MTTTAERISRLFEKKGYRNISVDKIDGTWEVTALDPLKEATQTFGSLGRSGQLAYQSILKIPSIPTHYICGYSYKCDKCGKYGMPLGYTEPVRGDFIHRCTSCRHEWVASTAEEQEEDARSRMHDALEIR
ncbi:hypothetical protein ABWF99_001287 [Pseudomonas aeruginosa]|jgi:hypothetical protein